jgi:hypothetical protein
MSSYSVRKYIQKRFIVVIQLGSSVPYTQKAAKSTHSELVNSRPQHLNLFL